MSIIVHTVTTIVTQLGVPMTVRYVAEGDRYGLNDCLILDKPRPMIEFYDARYPHHAGRGQFISRYYLDTLCEHPVGAGLVLEGSQPGWNVDAAALHHSINWAICIKVALAQRLAAEAIEGAA